MNANATQMNANRPELDAMAAELCMAGLAVEPWRFNASLWTCEPRTVIADRSRYSR